jgi:hypothetical protein
LDAFPRDYSLYEEHKKICLNFKENYITKHGIVAAKNLTNEELSVELGLNEYLDSKIKLATATSKVCSYLSIKNNLRDFLEEAFFSGSQVQFLAITKSPMCTDSKFRVFDRNDVVDVLERKIIVDSSMAGRDVRDLNVAAQKVLLKHVNPKGKLVNLGEIEIRNDSSTHYREVRFNVYSKEILQILNDEYRPHGVKQVGAEILVFGNARKNLP